MKPHHKPENDERLDEVLRQWNVDTPLPPRFQEQVWRRIDRAEAKPQATVSFWAWFLHLLEANLPRPKLAYSYALLLLLLGVFGGAWTAQRETSRMDAALGSRYVQSVDPYQKVALNQ
jgi:hypothetical protein